MVREDRPESTCLRSASPGGDLRAVKEGWRDSWNEEGRKKRFVEEGEAFPRIDGKLSENGKETRKHIHTRAYFRWEIHEGCFGFSEILRWEESRRGLYSGTRVSRDTPRTG